MRTIAPVADSQAKLRLSPQTTTRSWSPSRGICPPPWRQERLVWCRAHGRARLAVLCRDGSQANCRERHSPSRSFGPLGFPEMSKSPNFATHRATHAGGRREPCFPVAIAGNAASVATRQRGGSSLTLARTGRRWSAMWPPNSFAGVGVVASAGRVTPAASAHPSNAEEKKRVLARVRVQVARRRNAAHKSGTVEAMPGHSPPNGSGRCRSSSARYSLASQRAASWGSGAASPGLGPHRLLQSARAYGIGQRVVSQSDSSPTLPCAAASSSSSSPSLALV